MALYPKMVINHSVSVIFVGWDDINVISKLSKLEMKQLEY